MNRKLFAVCMAAILLLGGCGKDFSAAGSRTVGEPASGAGAAHPDIALNEAEGESALYESSFGNGFQESSVYQNAGVKLIRRAELHIQTEQFDQSLEALNRLVSDCGGYFEMANLCGGSRRDAYADRFGEYIARVPAEQYSRFLEGTGDLGYVVNKNESSENVGEQYYDTEARLKTQRTKQERLLSLLEKAESMEDIIALESALSEVEYQIEQYSSELNRYDALIGFSTFSIYLNEVGQLTQEVGETASLGTRLAAGVQSSVQGLARGAQDLMVWVSYHLFLVIVLAGAAAAAVAAGRRELKKLRRDQQKNEESKPE